MRVPLLARPGLRLAGFALLAGLIGATGSAVAANATSFVPPLSAAGAALPDPGTASFAVPAPTGTGPIPIASTPSPRWADAPGPPRSLKSLEQYRTNSLFMLRVSLMGLAPALPHGSGWVTFGIGTKTDDALRVWARTEPGAAGFLLTASSLLGVSKEILLDASGLEPDRSPLFDESPMPARLAEPEPVPEPGTGLLLGLGLLGLRHGARVR